MKILSFLIFYILLEGCSVESPINIATNSGEEFNRYWYNGKAEISVYQLEQSRYKQIRNGTAILIQVTEDFDKNTLVKPDQVTEGEIKVLKTNLIKKFNTGIYDYSVMTSVFTAINQKKSQPTVKLVCSVQEWCGQTWYQLNYKKSGYEVFGRSYFEKEVTENYELKSSFLIDEVLNQIRINPELLPTGNINAIPTLEQARFQHFKPEVLAYSATLSSVLQPDINGNLMRKYEMTTKSVRHSFIFHASFPHVIESWEEDQLDENGKSIPNLTTKARRVKTIRSSYWMQNGNEYESLRDSLDLPVFSK